MTVSSLSAAKRQAVLEKLLKRDGTIDLAEAAQACRVSEMTIRRDLKRLESQGVVKRVRGGAVFVEPERFDRRLAICRGAKEEIACKLLKLMPSHGLIAMDSSTTINQLAEIMHPAEIKVLTSGIENFLALRGKTKRAVLTGGEMEEETGNLVGPVAVRTLSDFYVTRAFLSISALHPEFGAMDSTVETAEFKRALRSRSRSVIMAVDSSKFLKTAATLSLPLSDIDLLVTELDPGDERLDPFRDFVELM